MGTNVDVEGGTPASEGKAEPGQAGRSPLKVGRALAVAVALLFPPAVAALLLLLPVARPAAPGPTAVPAPGGRAIRETERVAPGLTLTRITDPAGPQRIFVLELDPASELTLDVGLPRAILGSKGPLTRIAARSGAVAAVNGDYGTSSGRPLHLFLRDGELIQTSLINRVGRNVAWTEDARRVFVGRPELEIVVSDGNGSTLFEIRRWNAGAPGPGEVAAFTDAGGELEGAEPGTCSARLVPAGPSAWSPDRTAIRRDYRVETTRCGQDPVDVRPGAVVVTANPAGSRASVIGGLAPGTQVRLSRSVGWPGVLDAIGGSALLIQDGHIVTTPCHGAYECWRHPRTAIGVKEDGTIVLAVVDGRRPGYSIGMRREELAPLMESLGAVEALALDGGGSSEMVVEGKIVNRPSGNEERRIMSAVVILPGPDGGEPDALTGTDAGDAA